MTTTRTPPPDEPLFISAADLAEAVEMAVVEYAAALTNGTPPESVARTVAYAVAHGLRASHARPVTTAAELVRMDDVNPVRVDWLWPARIPRGRLTVLDGDPGLGKSALSLDLAARVTRGERMPDGALGLSGPAGVILMAAEDGLADTVRPRLDAAGADVERVVVLRGVRTYDDDGDSRTRLPTVQDVDALEDAIGAVDAALMIVDPLVAYLGPGVDSYRDQDVRAGLLGLAELAERTGVSVLAIRHLRKSVGGNPIHAGGGSIGIIAAARSGLLVAPDPDDPESERRILATTKCNLARRPPSLAWRLTAGRDGVLRIAWDGESTHEASALLEREDRETRSAKEEAADFLRAELEHGPVAVTDLRERADRVGLAWRTVRRARDVVGGASEREGGIGSAGRWVWSLPANAAGKGGQGVGHVKVAKGLDTFGDDAATSDVLPFPPPKGVHVPDVDALAPEGTPEPSDSAHRCMDCGESVGPTAERCARCQYGGES